MVLGLGNELLSWAPFTLINVLFLIINNLGAELYPPQYPPLVLAIGRGWCSAIFLGIYRNVSLYFLDGWPVSHRRF